MLIERGFFGNLAKKIKSASDFIDDAKAENNIYKMIKELKKNKGYDNTADKILNTYLPSALTIKDRGGSILTPADQNRLYVLLNSKNKFDNERLYFISQLAGSDLLDYETFKLIARPSNSLQAMKYLYYAVLNKIPLDIFYDGKKRKSEKDMLREIEKIIKNKNTKTKGTAEQSSIFQKVKDQGYNINRFRKISDKVSQEALAEILYAEVLNLPEEDIDALIALVHQNINDKYIVDQRKDFEKEKFKTETETPSLDNLLSKSIHKIRSEIGTRRV